MTPTEKYILRDIDNMVTEMYDINSKIIWYYQTKDLENPEKSRLENLHAEKSNKLGEALRLLISSK